MKARILAFCFGALVSLDATAGWFGSNNGYWDDNDWPEWTPMCWMEEMMGGWDNGIMAMIIIAMVHTATCQTLI